MVLTEIGMNLNYPERRLTLSGFFRFDYLLAFFKYFAALLTILSITNSFTIIIYCTARVLH